LKFRSVVLSVSSTDETAILNCTLLTDPHRENNRGVYVYPILAAKLQKKIIKQIEKDLNTKFNAYRYYYASAYDLPLNKKYFDQLVKLALPDPAKPNFRTILSGETENAYSMLDMLLNLCYKNGIDLKTYSDINFFGFGDYYDWLLDIDNFDYGKFKVRWIGLYATKFYFVEFRKHPIIKSTLETYLKTHRDNRMERLYLDLYNPLNIESVED